MGGYSGPANERRSTAVQDACPKVPLSNTLLCQQRPRLRDAPEPLTSLKSHGSINSHNPTSTETTQSSSLRNTRQRPHHRKQVLRTALGWKFSKWGEQDYWLIAHKDAPANETMGGLFKRNAPNEQFVNYFSVNSIDESAAKATGLGAQVVTAKQEIPTVGYFAVLRDPDGNVFALFQSTDGM